MGKIIVWWCPSYNAETQTVSVSLRHADQHLIGPPTCMNMFVYADTRYDKNQSM